MRSLITLSALLCLLSLELFSQTKEKIYYVYDPLCGWCFAYAPVIEKISEEFKDKIEFVIIPGGMIARDNQTPIGVMAPYLLKAIPELEQISGTKIGKPFIDMVKDGSYIPSSYKPSLAMVVFKSFHTGHDLEYSFKVQHAYFVDGKDLANDSLYMQLALSFGVEPSMFLTRMNDAAYDVKTQEHFDFAAYLNVKGFPSLIGKSEGKYMNLTYGYTTEEESRRRINKFLKK